MSEITSKYLPEGTILTTEGKDKILTGKLQREVAFCLAERIAHWTPTLTELSARMRDVAPQNVHRTVKALEAKGILKTVKGVKGEVTIHHCISTNDEGALYIQYDLKGFYSSNEAIMPGGAVVGNVDYVAAIQEGLAGDQSKVFKSIKQAREGDTRWYILEFNKPDLYKLAALKFMGRVDLAEATEALAFSHLYPLIEQAARGAWQPFFDTMKKNKVIQYHEFNGSRVMFWDVDAWSTYSTRVLKERQAIIDSWKV
ncbi:hypothetical protein CJP72_21085 [Citrobacter sp. NCU1]|uniref:hypothetical protein n=1 Tax=Citrobacter sp. NCU1 TaxID=2026683 RepID=UPI001390F0C6|nr:hypothetical protein [Citrobacter sp. NCU1]NDO83172.1 hypothetical protein [Citrobacter sp. NCU1]